MTRLRHIWSSRPEFPIVVTTRRKQSKQWRNAFELGQDSVHWPARQAKYFARPGDRRALHSVS